MNESNFDEYNFDELIVGFVVETLRGKVSRENFDKSLAIRQSFQHQILCNIRIYITQLIRHSMCYLTYIVIIIYITF